MKFNPFILAYALLIGEVHASLNQMDVIYGDDNRKDVYESRESHLVELSKSTAGMVKNANLSASGSMVNITAPTLESKNICSSERFSKQMTAANCSGFLVSENVLVTAGHCIKTMDDCNAYKWVFDYKMDHADQKTISVPSSSVYSCSKIISRSLDLLTQNDFAVIQLDRKVRDRRPLSFRRTGKVPVGESLVVIGHPSGLPTKIADGAKVRSHNRKFFVANLDTFGGNSGSAVFNARTGEVEGILVRGENDYVTDGARGCKVAFKCKDDMCRGEDVTFMSSVTGLP